jgi:hypothetical protein
MPHVRRWGVLFLFLFVSPGRLRPAFRLGTKTYEWAPTNILEQEGILQGPGEFPARNFENKGVSQISRFKKFQGGIFMTNAITPILYTNDVDATVRYYTNLGFKLEFGITDAQGKGSMAMMMTPCEQGRFMVEYDKDFKTTGHHPILLYANVPGEMNIDEIYTMMKDKGINGHRWTVSKEVTKFEPSMVPEGLRMMEPVSA